MLPLLTGVATKMLGPAGSTSAKTKKISKEKLLGSSDIKSGKESIDITKKSVKLLPAAPKLLLPESTLGKEHLSSKPGKKISVDGLKNKGEYISKVLDNIINYFKTKKKNTQKEIEYEKKNEEIKKKGDREEELEKKPTGGRKFSMPSVPGVSFLERIINFFTSILLGSFLVFLLKNSNKIFKTLDDISKGITNIWDVIRLGIISLSVTAGGLIKSVAKLGVSLFKGPAKLTGKLISNLGKSIKNVFKGLGKFVVNNIKRMAGLAMGAAPGTRGGGKKRVDPSKGGRQTSPVKPIKPGTPKQTNPSVLNRAKNLFSDKGSKHLGKVSKVFKKIPFIGALIGIGIDMAMGERLDNAIAGAAGASLGAAIGGAIGTFALPIPGLGSFLGGMVGAAIGDWAGKEIYKKLSGQMNEINPPESELNAAPGVGTGPMGGQISQVQGQVSGGNADFWTLAAIASLESGTPQGQADVAQSIYNRVSAGIFPGGRSIKNVIIAPSQYSPVHESDPSKWAAIVDEATAIAAVASHRRGGVNAARMVSNAAQNINNPQLQEEAKNFVGGRTDFNALSVYSSDPPNAISVVKRHGHRFGFWVGPGSISYGQNNPGPANSPNLGGATTTPAQTSPAAPSLTPPQQQLSTPSQGQLSPQQTTRSSQGLSQQASYEQQSSPVIVMGGGGAQPSGGSYGTGGITPLPYGLSKKQALNSYYQAQLIGFLYKQG